MVGRCRGMVLGSRGVIFGDRGILGLSFIGDFGNKAFISIRVVLDMLDTSIRKVDRIRSFHIAGSVTRLASTEHRLGVVVGYGVVVRVGDDLVRIVRWLSMVRRLSGCMVRGGGGCVSRCRSSWGWSSGISWSWGRVCWSWGRCRVEVIRWGLVRCGSHNCDEAKKDLKHKLSKITIFHLSPML